MGATEFIYPLIGYNLYHGEQLDNFLRKNIKASIIQKMIISISDFKNDVDSLDCALYKYSLNYLWFDLGRTDSETTKNSELTELSAHSQLLGKTLKFIYNLLITKDLLNSSNKI